MNDEIKFSSFIITATIHKKCFSLQPSFSFFEEVRTSFLEIRNKATQRWRVPNLQNVY